MYDGWIDLLIVDAVCSLKRFGNKPKATRIEKYTYKMMIRGHFVGVHVPEKTFLTKKVLQREDRKAQLALTYQMETAVVCVVVSCFGVCHG